MIMDKIISFTGKHTIDKMTLNVFNLSESDSINVLNNLNEDNLKKLNTSKIRAKRNQTIHLDDIYLDYNCQIEMINQLYLMDSCKEDVLLKREIDKKINGYKKQDINKKIFDDSLLISLPDVIEKLVSSKLICVYCKCNVLLLYKDVRDEKQWTLDRIDNDKCHSNSNTMISCLKCNLQRRTRDMEKFKFTKQLKIKKQE
jgi:hypothetical protein